MLANYLVVLLVAIASVAGLPSTGISRTMRFTIVNKHNDARRELRAADVSKIHWSNDLAQLAAEWAAHCQFMHQPGQQTGENLASAWGSSINADYVVNQGLTMWHSEKNAYVYNNDFMAAGHYTQMIWSSTTRVGCAVKQCPTMYFFVCKYSPPGNIYGRNPYSKGKVCSKCPTGKRCQDGLCD